MNNINDYELDSSMAQDILQYMDQRLPFLEQNMTKSTSQLSEHQQKLSKIIGKQYPEFIYNDKVNKLNERLNEMDMEIQTIKKLQPHLQLLLLPNSTISLPLWILLSNYIKNTIQHLESMYDHDFKTLQAFQKYSQQLERIIQDNLPHSFSFNIPYILIQPENIENNSTYIEIYDYLSYTLQFVENNIEILHYQLLKFSHSYPDATDDVLQRWQKPIDDLIAERMELNDLRFYFQKVIAKAPQTTGSDFLQDGVDIPHTFFEGLLRYLEKKIHHMIAQKSEDEKNINTESTCEFMKRQLLIKQLEINKLIQYIEEVGPLCDHHDRKRSWQRDLVTTSIDSSYKRKK